jgi:hypothetical protein
MNQILKYLQTQHQKTKFQFFPLPKLKKRFGKETSKMLNDLHRNGYIDKRPGINYPLVELLKYSHDSSLN